MIIYFTGTGNSEHVAKNLAKEIDDKLYSINNALKENINGDFINEETIILVCPTYAWKIPNIVRDFIKGCSFKKHAKIYFIMTCGGEISNAGKFNEQLAMQKDLIYMGSFPILMPDNYIVMFKPIKEDKANKLVKDANLLIKEASNLIKKQEKFKKLKVTLLDKMKSSSINKGFYKGYIDPKGWRVKDNCTSCKVCEKKCPLNNIKLVNGKPIWGKNCTHCMACISYCPVSAIEFKNKTVGKRRYTFSSYIK